MLLLAYTLLIAFEQDWGSDWYRVTTIDDLRTSLGIPSLFD